MDDEQTRRSVGAPAARSMLLTLLGEYVQPRREVYRDVLVAALETLGYKTATARQAIARSERSGLFASQPVGRRSLLTLADTTLAMLRAGYPRIFHVGEARPWDGRWLLLVVRVPEQRRELRDRLRTQLAWAGFGSLGGGLWITPHVERAAEARAVVDGAAGVELLGFSTELLRGFGTPSALVAQAWDLDEIAAHYRAFVEDFRGLRPREPEATFRAQVTMVHAWRKLPFVDPGLPGELLPERWPRDEARELFAERHARWREASEAYFASLGA